MSFILDRAPLGFQWPTLDPFLFCVHHNDAYPAGNDQLGPAASLKGRDLGQDFAGVDGWRMYHGSSVPGFPPHPHRGFETVTIAREGLIDHSDSLGAAARFGNGDVQWLTAGRGIVHSEMFPLLSKEHGNPAELFQIWLNLPRRSKLAEPHFSMFWKHQLPAWSQPGAEVSVVAGRFGEVGALPAPPNSWASAEGSDVAIWNIRLAPGAKLTLPVAAPEVNRMLYFFAGRDLQLGGEAVRSGVALHVRSDVELPILNGAEASELLVLQGKPIGEPVVQYGPFVMNTQQEIMQAMNDYRRTEFGGWPWPSQEPTHGATKKRFARFPDGRVEEPA